MKKLFAIILALALCLSMASFAGAESADALTEGRWAYSFTAEGYGEYVYYFHFYKDVPGFGNLFYAGFANNGIAFAGTWSVEEAEFAYSDVSISRDSDEKLEGAAPYTISFFDWNGNLLDTCGYDGEYIYNTMESIYGMYSAPNRYFHDTEGKFASTYEEEKGVTVVDFVSPDDATCTVTLYHNATYMDMMDIMVEGSWAMAENEDGSRVYTLTPAEEGDAPATLTVAADGQTAHYANEEGTEADLENAKKGPELAHVLKGVFNIAAYGMDANLTMNLYDDGTCELIAEVAGREAKLDGGAWQLGEDGFTITLTMTKAGQLTSELNMETYLPEVHYTQEGTDIGDIDTVLTLVKE